MANREVHLTVGAVIVRNHKVLMVLHKKLNLWLFPGGHVEPGEMTDAAVIREVKEETGLDFRPSDYGPVKYSKDMNGGILAVPFHANWHGVGDHDHFNFYYLGKVNSSKARVSNESNGIRWFGIDEIRRLDKIPNSVRKMAEYVLKGRKAKRGKSL